MLPELETLREEVLRFSPTPLPSDPGVQDPDCFSLEFRELDRASSLRPWGSYPSPPPSDPGIQTHALSPLSDPLPGQHLSFHPVGGCLGFAPQSLLSPGRFVHTPTESPSHLGVYHLLRLRPGSGAQ